MLFWQCDDFTILQLDRGKEQFCLRNLLMMNASMLFTDQAGINAVFCKKIDCFNPDLADAVYHRKSIAGYQIPALLLLAMPLPGN